MHSFSQLFIECLLWIHFSPGIYQFSVHEFLWGCRLCYISVLSVWFCKDCQMFSVVSHTVGYLKCWGRPIICLTASLIYCDLGIVKSNGYDLHLYVLPICCTHLRGSSWQQCNAKIFIYDGQMLKLWKIFPTLDSCYLYSVLLYY